MIKIGKIVYDTIHDLLYNHSPINQDNESRAIGHIKHSIRLLVEEILGKNSEQKKIMKKLERRMKA